MRETLPDVMLDDRVPALFLTGFTIILLMMVAILVAIAISRQRARTAGIYRKYAAPEDQPNHRRVLD